MKKRKVTLAELERAGTWNSYQEFYEYMIEKINDGTLSPIVNAGLNGKKPALYLSYWKPEKEQDDSQYIEELQYQLYPALNPDFYLNHLEQYKQERAYVQKLNHYLYKRKYLLEREEALNERSYEIFGEEKFLDEKGGASLLKRLQIDNKSLVCYETSVPMSYYTVHKKTPQNVVIIENKDTFYSMRKYLIEENSAIMGLEIGTLVYGAGKGIYKSFFDYANRVEHYFGDSQNQVYYWGDLDYEGIEIYEKLVERYEKIPIIPWKEAYERMIAKSEETIETLLQDTKKGQKVCKGERFFSFFSKESQERIKKLLFTRKYIPQESVNIYDYGNNT